MLRGQQTVGEIKGRAERLYAFSDLDEVEMVIQKLMDRPGGAFVQKLAAAPGMKEPRYAQTLGGAVDPAAVAAPVASGAGGSASDRLSALEGDVAQLRAEVAELRRLLESVL
jgi:uncharacterized protein YceH (UPF0502 family)